MDGLLAFFHDIMLFTGGLVTVLFWAFVIFAVVVEIYDTITGKGKTEEEDY
jgi:hypothetical protein